MTDNASKSKLIAKNTLMLYIRMLFTMGISLYTSRVILKVLGIEDYGIYGVVGGVIWTFSFLTNSMSGATQRFLSFSIGKNDDEELRKIFSMSLEIYVILALLILFLGETVGLWFVENKLTIPSDRLSAALWVYHASVFTCVTSILTIPFNATIISHEKMSIFAYFSIYEVTAKLLIVFMLEWFAVDKLKLYSILVLLVQFSLQIAYQIYCRYYFKETKLHFFWEKKKFLEMMGYSGWSIIGYGALVANSQGLNIVLNIFFGPVVNAARAIASQVENAVGSFVHSFQSAVNPQVVKEYAASNINRMHNLVYASCKYSYFLLFTLCIPIYINLSTVLNLWLNVVPDHTVNFLHITLISSLINTQANPMSVAVGATGMVKKFTLATSSLQFLVLPLSYISFIYLKYPEIAMIIYLIVSLLVQIVRLWIVRSMIGLSVKRYIRYVLQPILSVTMTSGIASYFLAGMLDNSVMCFFITSAFSVSITLLSIYILGLSEFEKAVVKKHLCGFCKFVL